MCGIVGVARMAGAVDPEILGRMRDTLAHRGPDDAGLWISADGRVGLAMRRLAIIDLSPGGHQPMVDSATGVVVTFNGEIYNYRELRAELEGLGESFRTHSDTEVLLSSYRRWGTSCLDRLNGMFAFGLFDPRTQEILLARDRAGEKPLFYRISDGSLSFSSELKAQLADPDAPRRLDPEGLEFFLAYGYVPGDRCLLSGYRKLAQGHSLTWSLDTGACRIHRYWDLPDHRASAKSAMDLEDELESLLQDSTRLRLVADVPVGILLSGGIDSSLVTAMAARVSSSPVHTFTVSFPGQTAFDEAPHARLVARHFGTVHTELVAEPAALDLLPLLARQFDEPIGDASMLPTYLVSCLIRQHAKVALGGDGGDELFAGYSHYGWTARHGAWRRRVPGAIRRGLGRGATSIVPLGVPGRAYLMAGSGDASWSIANTAIQFDTRSRERLLTPAVRALLTESTKPEAWRLTLGKPAESALQEATRADFRSYLVDDILVKVDRASMLTSLEVRAPWLDPRVIDFAYRDVPDVLRSAGSQKKILPRGLAARVLPKELDLSRKQGFSVPLAGWIRGGFGAFIREVLGGADRDVFEPAFVRRLLRAQEAGLVNEDRLFTLTMFELWRRAYGVSL